MKILANIYLQKVQKKIFQNLKKLKVMKQVFMKNLQIKS